MHVLQILMERLMSKLVNTSEHNNNLPDRKEEKIIQNTKTKSKNISTNFSTATLPDAFVE